MRILIIDPIFSTLPYDRALCTGLIAQGHQVAIAARPLRPGESWGVTGVQHFELLIQDVMRATKLKANFLRLYTLLRHVQYGFQIRKIEEIVRKFRPDVVHFQWCLTPLAETRLVNRLGRHAAILLTVHDTKPFNGSRVSSLVTRGLDRLMTKFDHLVVHTQAAADELVRRGLYRKDLSVVPHGLLHDPNVFSGKPSGQTAEKSTLITCLLFGYIKHYKGVDVLIRAVAAMPEHFRKRMRFVVAGQPGIEFSELLKLCEDAGVAKLFRFDLRFFPESEVDPVMRSADIFVFPYREIQASGVFTLALPYGRPIVASRLGIFEERILDGINGFLIPPEDHVALAGALERLCADASLRQRMGEANLRVSKEFPSWAEIGRLTTQAYETALLQKHAISNLSV